MLQRAILHVDVDCFYAQVEMIRNPSIDRDRPVAVTQKFLVVTCNYPARAAGVGKLMRIDKAKEICPDLALVSGEDLTPYREASESIFAALSAFGPCQKLGLDELFVDVTALAEAEVGVPWASGCNVHYAVAGTRSAEAEAHTGTNYRPQDLRAAAAASSSASDASWRASDDAHASQQQLLLRAASAVAVRCKAAVLAQSGLTVSVGVACNKLLAKLVSGLHKPDGLSALPPSESVAFLRPLDVRVLPGVGFAATSRLHAAGLRTVGDVAALPGGP